MDRKLIAIYGAGGFAREVAWLISYLEDYDLCNMVCFIDDSEHRQKTLNDKPVMSFDEAIRAFPEAKITVAIGDPKAREAIVKRCTGIEFPILEHHDNSRSKFVEIGAGAIICANTVLTTNISIGEHVHINLGCTIGHDVRIGDYTTLAPGVHVSGNVHIGRGVYVGTGANIINGTADSPLTIGDGAVVAAGACVTKSVDAGTMVAGVPAQFKKSLSE